MLHGGGGSSGGDYVEVRRISDENRWNDAKSYRKQDTCTILKRKLIAADT